MKRFLNFFFSFGSYLIWRSKTIFAILVEDIMVNIHVNLF